MSPNAATQVIVIKNNSECVAAVLVDHGNANLHAERQLYRLRVSHYEGTKDLYQDYDAYLACNSWWVTTLNLV
jgi:hypothetical protein